MLDAEISDEVLNKISYGSLSFEAEGHYLTVIIPQGEEEVFSHRSIESLNQKLADAVAAVGEARNAHHRMVQEIARNTGLPIV